MATCHNTNGMKDIEKKAKSLLLIGNPNVGKSAIFSNLTGTNSIASNYSGTTVTYSKGEMVFNKTVYEIIDVPGTYDLNPESDAEKAAIQMINEGDIFINVLDATNLERNLNLTLQLFKLRKPMIIALNMWDETKHKGIEIDVKRLEEMLGVPVVPTSGISGLGMKELAEKCRDESKVPVLEYDEDERWHIIGNIVSAAQELKHRHHTILDRLQDISIHSIFGFPLAGIMLFLIFWVIISLGEFFISLISIVFEKLYSPIIFWISDLLGESFFQKILIGDISRDGIIYEEAMGVLTTGIYITLGVVLPYIIVFYLILGFLEDLGYIPRLAVIFDRLMHKIGLHGYSLVPMILGLGCNVPGIMALRNLERRREKFITGVIMLVAFPCLPQTAIMLQFIGRRGMVYVGILFATLLLVLLTIGLFLKKSVKGETSTLLVEKPPYRMPRLKIQAKKKKNRALSFITEAVPLMLGGILLINVFNLTGIINYIGKVFEPILKGLWGLPSEIITSLIIGLVRKDAAVAILEPLGLSNIQIVVASIVLIMYFPCVATFIIYLKEMKLKDTLKSFGIILIVTLITGALLNLTLNYFNPGTFIIIEIILIGILTFSNSILSRIRIKKLA